MKFVMQILCDMNNLLFETNSIKEMDNGQQGNKEMINVDDIGNDICSEKEKIIVIRNDEKSNNVSETPCKADKTNINMEDKSTNTIAARMREDIENKLKPVIQRAEKPTNIDQVLRNLGSGKFLEHEETVSKKNIWKV